MAIENKAVLPSNKQGIIFGLVTGLVMVFYNLYLERTDVAESSWLNFIVLVIFLIGVLWFCFAFAKGENNDTSFGGMFKGGFRMVAIVTLVLLAAALISVFVNPAIKQEIMNNNMRALIADKKSPQEIKDAMKFTEDKFILLIMMKTVFAYIFYGVVFALVGAAIFRRNKV